MIATVKTHSETSPFKIVKQTLKTVVLLLKAVLQGKYQEVAMQKVLWPWCKRRSTAGWWVLIDVLRLQRFLFLLVQEAKIKLSQYCVQSDTAAEKNTDNEISHLDFQTLGYYNMIFMKLFFQPIIQQQQTLKLRNTDFCEGSRNMKICYNSFQVEKTLQFLQFTRFQGKSNPPMDY